MITVQNLCFGYTKAPFIENMSFSVEQGEIFGFLGPSGAGKSTLQKLLTGLLGGYTGSAVAAGTEIAKRGRDFYEKIGVDFEFPCLYEKLTARENLDFFGSLYQGPLRSRDALLDSVGLLRDADKKVAGFSKGMKARLGFIRALLHDPALLFLDEPTSGLDPANARVMKDLILAERDAGKTLVLTTHNMADAAELCDRVAFIVDGTIRALDTPHNLVMRRGAARLVYTWLENGGERSAACPLDGTGDDAVLSALVAGGRLRTIHSQEPTLNDVFLEITGRALQ